MKVVACANNSNVEEYLRLLNSLDKIELCEVVHDYEDLLISVEKNLPDVLFILSNRGNRELANFIQTLRESYSPRVIVFYGSDNEDRENFINFLINNEVYDYFVGTKFDKEIVDELLFKPKNKESAINNVLNYRGDITTYQSEEEETSSEDDCIVESNECDQGTIYSPDETTASPEELQKVVASSGEKNIDSKESSQGILTKDSNKTIRQRKSIDKPRKEETKKPVEVKPKQVREQDPFIFVRDYIDKLSFEEKKQLGLVEEREKVKNNILGTVIIAVAGISPNVGCTHVAINLAYFLSRHINKYKVAVVQLNEKKDFQALCEYGLDNMISEKAFRYKKVDFYFDTPFIDVKRKDYYKYIILDIGTLKMPGNRNGVIKNIHYDMMHLANLSILVCNSVPWKHDILNMNIFDGDGCTESGNWKLLFNLSDNDFYDDIRSKISDTWDVYRYPYCPSLFKVNSEGDNVLTEVLQKVLPERDKVTTVGTGLLGSLRRKVRGFEKL